jgi:hypothetical protein
VWRPSRDYPPKSLFGRPDERITSAALTWAWIEVRELFPA